MKLESIYDVIRAADELIAMVDHVIDNAVAATDSAQALVSDVNLKELMDRRIELHDKMKRLKAEEIS